MTEKEFKALLAVEGRNLDVETYRFRDRKLQIVPYYAVAVISERKKIHPKNPKYYRSRAYAIQKLIKDYYADN